MELRFYQLDAFSGRPFGGNPAAVFPLERWLDDATMRAIAAEKNLPASAFFVPDGNEFAIRWFSPAAELQLCGHATLASGYVLIDLLRRAKDGVTFSSRAGRLEVAREGRRLGLDFPALPPEKRRDPELVSEALGVCPIELWEADRGMAVLADAAQVRDLRPDISAIESLPFSTLIVTARGFENDCDFVSRYFAPKWGIAEDFVTGSAHCVLTPYWAHALKKPRLFARQLSSRGGELWVEDRGNRVRIAGECVPIAEGTFTLSL